MFMNLVYVYQYIKRSKRRNGLFLLHGKILYVLFYQTKRLYSIEATKGIRCSFQSFLPVFRF